MPPAAELPGTDMTLMMTTVVPGKKKVQRQRTWGMFVAKLISWGRPLVRGGGDGREARGYGGHAIPLLAPT
jgi:hypothetical protein